MLGLFNCKCLSESGFWTERKSEAPKIALFSLFDLLILIKLCWICIAEGTGVVSVMKVAHLNNCRMSEQQTLSEDAGSV